jgi:flagellar hook-length control protein FliK
MNINIKDVNVLERLLPNQHSSNGMSQKQVDAGFKNVYENRIQQNNQTASTRLEKQNKMPDERVKAKLENAFEKNEAFVSRVKERNNERKSAEINTNRSDVAKEAQRIGERKSLTNDSDDLAIDELIEKPSVNEDVEVKNEIGTDETNVSEEVKDTEEVIAAEETSSPLTTYMLMILKAAEEMSAKLENLNNQSGANDDTKAVVGKLQDALQTLQNSLTALNVTASPETNVVTKFTNVLDVIQTFNDTIKDILKALPQALKGDMTDAANSDKTLQINMAKGVLQDIKEILKSPLTQIHTKPLMQKIEHVEGKTEKWIEQEIRKMMGSSKNDTSIKETDVNGLSSKDLKEVKNDPLLKKESSATNEKNVANSGSGAVTSTVNKAKGESADQRVVHLEQIGTPIDKQIVKIIEKNSESQGLFKSILTQVQEGVKTTLKVTGDSSEMVMKLKPESLGDVSVKITVHKNSIIAEMTVQSQIVKEALEASLMDLKSTLKDKGFDVSQINVNVGHEQQSKESRNPNHSNRQSSRYKGISEAIGNDLPDIGVIKTFIQNGKMDYFA